MTVTTFIGERYEHTHENQAFEQLCILVEEVWGDDEDHYSLIGNVTCNGHELDALLIKPAALVIIDFKNFGGDVVFSENGPWKADGIEVKGGSKINPYKQIHANKFALLDWVKNRLPYLAEDNNLGHISGLVLFQQPVNIDTTQIPPKIASWFNTGDFSSGLTWLRHLASPSILLNSKEQLAIVEALNVSRYQLPGAITTKSLQKRSSEQSTPELNWTHSQKEAIRAYETLLSSHDPISVLSITGMISTGKTSLIKKFVELADFAGRETVLLTSNSRIASYLKEHTGQDFKSIYGHIYDLSNEVEEDNSPLPFNPVSQCESSLSAIYIIDEAQLLSDEYYELDDKRFGSGHTLTDFIEHILTGRETNVLLVMLGDPYQIQSDISFIKPSAYLSKNIPYKQIELIDIIGDTQKDSILETACQLVESINRGFFHELNITPRNSQVVIACNDKNKRSENYSKIFTSEKGKALFITYSHQRVSQAIDWGRKRFLKRTSRLPEPGDILELRNKIELFSSSQNIEQADTSSDDFLDGRNEVYPGTYIEVLKVEHSTTVKSILLKGRKHESFLTLGHIKSVPNRDLNESIFYLEEYLLAEKPELFPDTLIALKAIVERQVKQDEEYIRLNSDLMSAQKKYKESKSAEHKEALRLTKVKASRRKNKIIKRHPLSNSARLRYAYAATCHHARGRKWDYVVVDASYNGQGRTNKGYFEWLYTAITRAKCKVVIDLFEPITPWDKTQVKSDNVVITPIFKTFFNLPYEKSRVTISEQARYVWPLGMSDDKPELKALFLCCSEYLSKENIAIKSVRQHAYQEHYTVVDSSGEEAIIILHYNGRFDVTNIRAQVTDTKLVQRALSALKVKPIFETELANNIFQLVAVACQTAGLAVEGGKEHPWQLLLSLSNAEQQHASIKVHYKSEGYPSTIEIEKATHLAIVQQIHTAFGQPKEQLIVS